MNKKLEIVSICTTQLYTILKYNTFQMSVSVCSFSTYIRIHPPNNVSNDDGAVFKFQLQDKENKTVNKIVVFFSKQSPVIVAAAAPPEEYALWFPITGAVFWSQTRRCLLTADALELSILDARGPELAKEDSAQSSLYSGETRERFRAEPLTCGTLSTGALSTGATWDFTLK